VTAVLLYAAVAVAADNIRPSGVYSNLHYNKEGGDLLGAEVIVFPSDGPTGFSALVQLAEGGAPVAFLVPARVTGARVEFAIPKGGPYAGLSFSGVVSRTELVGRWSSGTAFGGAGDTERLKRGKSYWQ
jgi:hypothetical protein